MNNPFDELTKGLAQTVTRRQAFKKFGFGLAGVALAAFGLANKAQAGGDVSLICCRYSYGGNGRKSFQYNLCQSPMLPCSPSIIAGEVPYTLVGSRKVNSCTQCA